MLSRSGLLTRLGSSGILTWLGGGSVLAGLSSSGILSRPCCGLKSGSRSGLLPGLGGGSLDHLRRGGSWNGVASGWLLGRLAAVPLDLVAGHLALLLECEALLDNLLGVNDADLLGTTALLVHNG